MIIKEKLEMAFASPLALFLVSVSQLHAASPYWAANRRSFAITSSACMIHEKRAKKTSYASFSPPIASCTCSLMLFSSRPGSPSQSHTGADYFASANI